jgi:hypothetical protein
MGRHRSQKRVLFNVCYSESPRSLYMRFYLYLHDCKPPILACFRVEAIIHRILLLTPNSCQALHTPCALQRRVPDQLEVIPAIIGKAFVVRNADFVCDKDMAPGCDNGRPKDGHGGAHYSEVDFETGDDKDFRIPPSEVETLGKILTMLEGAPKAKDSHEYDAVSVNDNYEDLTFWTYIEPRANNPVIARTCFRLRSGLKYSVRGTRKIAISNSMLVAAKASTEYFASLTVRYPKP